MRRREHEKPKRPKRLEVTDDDGWTRITTTNKKKRKPWSSAPLVHMGQKTTPGPGSSPDTLRVKYEEREKEWLASESCKVLVELLRDRLLAKAFHVETCMIFGSASFCGVWQGWRERQDVAFIQLAVLKTIQNTIETVTKRTVSAYAQDPAYNDFDVKFLHLLDVVVISDPDGFNLVDSKSLVYTPNAELFVEMEVIRRQPAVLLTGKLDWYWRNQKGEACTRRVRAANPVDVPTSEEVEGQSIVPIEKDYTAENAQLEEECQAFEALLAVKQTASLPRMDHRDEPFYNQHLYWPNDAGDADE